MEIIFYEDLPVNFVSKSSHHRLILQLRFPVRPGHFGDQKTVAHILTIVTAWWTGVLSKRL